MPLKSIYENTNSIINCLACENYIGRLIDGMLLCGKHGPVLDITYCKQYEPKQKNEPITKAMAFDSRKCKDCMRFHISGTKEITYPLISFQRPEYWGSCEKFLQREYDGATHRACALAKYPNTCTS